jgi:hypothetical protein
MLFGVKVTDGFGYTAAGAAIGILVVHLIVANQGVPQMPAPSQ